MLPQTIKETFFRVLTGEISLSEFEKWVYEQRDLEAYLPKESYMELISFNFRSRLLRRDLEIFLRRHIDSREFENYRIFSFLETARLLDFRLGRILMQFYELYCQGYSFLFDLGVGYGLAFENMYDISPWEESPEDINEEIIAVYSSELMKSIERLLELLRSGKIVITGERREDGNFIFEDYRTEEERNSSVQLRYTEHDLNNVFQELITTNNDLEKYFLEYLRETYSDKTKERLYQIDMAQIGEYIVQSLKLHETEWFSTFFDRVEGILQSCDDKVENLIVIGLFESIQNRCRNQEIKFRKKFKKWLKPLSWVEWDGLIDFWNDKSKV